RERPNDVGVEAHQPADAQMRKLTVLSPVVHPRPAHLKVTSHIVRVPQLVTERSRRARRTPRRPHELARRRVVIHVILRWEQSSGSHRALTTLSTTAEKNRPRAISPRKQQVFTSGPSVGQAECGLTAK